MDFDKHSNNVRSNVYRLQCYCTILLDFYAVFMILLVVVLFTGAINGATSWFNMGLLSFQPGELAKIFVILFLSYTIVNIQANGKNQINRPSKLAIVLLIGLAPTFLIAIQPDYGTALAYIVAITLILYVAGIDKKYIITTFAILVIALPLLYFLYYQTMQNLE